MLFADVSGFTELVDTVDPEIVYEVIQPLLDELVLVVDLHGGEIQQVLGDGFMCVFGLYDTLGDEAQRAVRAGMALLAAGGVELARPSVHVGVEYGEVLVTPSWRPAGFGVWGRTVNIAQRLCDLAGPGEIQIGPGAFARHGHRPFSASPVRAHLKGVSGAVLSHRVAVRHSGPLAAAG